MRIKQHTASYKYHSCLSYLFNLFEKDFQNTCCMNSVQRAIKISVVYLKLISPTSGTYSEKMKTESTGIDLI